jgi:DUF1680 family protein
VTISQLTRFPDEPTTKLVVHTAAPVPLRLKIRSPAWCQGASVRVNGRAHAVSRQPDGYLEINRRWHDGDTVDVELPMQPYRIGL